MDNERKHKWIRDEVDISSFYDRLSPIVKDLIKDAEQAEAEGRDMSFYEISDNIEIQAKLLIPDVISQREWELLCEKYYPTEESMFD